MRIIAAVLLLLVSQHALPNGAALADAANSTLFVRVAEDRFGQPRALQVAIASYGRRSGEHGLRVDLIGAIHIGDKSYYADLNERFSRYDALLYELIAPKGAVVARDDAGPKGVLSTTQVAMKNMLGLSFQLDEIDYGARNFVHADLSPSELSESMDERGESLYVYFWRLFYASMNQYARDPLGLNDMQKMSAMLSSNADNAFKVMLAYELLDLDAYSEILGDDADSAVIGARNQRAIDELRKQLDSGAERVAIFYGVAHMPDMEQRLLQQLDLVYLDTTWIDAWRLDGPQDNRQDDRPDGQAGR
jgi:hypothetical protein